MWWWTFDCSLSNKNWYFLNVLVFLFHLQYSIKYRIDVYQTLNTISDPNDGPNKIISKTDETFENENGNYSLNMRW